MAHLWRRIEAFLNPKKRADRLGLDHETEWYRRSITLSEWPGGTLDRDSVPTMLPPEAP